MADATAMLRDLYGYHWWANRRLFEAAAALGDAVCAREIGRQFSVPTLKGMLAHIHGADHVWFARFAGSPARLLGDADFPSMDELRARWDDLEKSQRVFLERLTPAALDAAVTYTSSFVPGRSLSLPLGPLLQHVANHATHHRSELATMLTIVNGSPPGTDLVVYRLIASGQLPADHAGWR